MANTFATLKTELQAKVGRSNAEFTAQLGAFINDIINEITSEMNYWFMKRTSNYNLTASDDPAQYSLSDENKEPDEVYLVLTNSYKSLDILSLKDALAILSPNETRAEPQCVVIENALMTVSPPPDQNYTLMLVSWSRFTELSADGDDNFLVINKKDLVMAGAIRNAFAFLQEYQDAGYWDSQFRNKMGLLRREHNSRILSGELTLVPKTDIKAAIGTERFHVGTKSPQGYY